MNTLFVPWPCTIFSYYTTAQPCTILAVAPHAWDP